MLTFLHWFMETAFWLLLLLILMPLAVCLWLAGKPLRASDLFRYLVLDLLHWRQGGSSARPGRDVLARETSRQ